MSIARTTLAIMVAATGLFAGTSTAVAASDYHIDNIALRLERQARELTRELRYNFRHAPHYGHLISDARDVARSARHIHDVAHRGGSLRHLRSDLREIDEKVHHLTDVMRDIRADVHHGDGHFDGNPRRAFRLIRSMQETVHHLQRDVRQAIRARSGHHGHRHHVRHGGPGHITVPVGRSAGITWSHGGITVRLGRAF